MVNSVNFLLLVLVGISLTHLTAAAPSSKSSGKGLCPNGSSYQVDCNTCFCDAKTGTGGCTLMACFTSSNQPAPSVPVPPPSVSRLSRAPKTAASEDADADAEDAGGNLDFEEDEDESAEE